jgi:hypothetical protein
MTPLDINSDKTGFNICPSTGFLQTVLSKKGARSVTRIIKRIYYCNIYIFSDEKCVAL